MKIGLISDTHGYLDPKIFTHFKDVDEIWHAGDIGEGIFEELAAFKPLKAVFGNIDGPPLSHQLPEDLRFTCDGLDVWMTHIGGKPPHYNRRVKPLLKDHTPQIFICGHSHILQVAKDPTMKNMIYLNPGAAGNQGFHRMKTLMRFRIYNGKLDELQVIELGLRGSLPARGEKK